MWYIIVCWSGCVLALQGLQTQTMDWTRRWTWAFRKLMIYARHWMDAFASQPSGVTARLPTLQDFSIELNCETPFHANEYNDCRQAGCNASAAMFSIPHEQKKRRSIAHGAVYLTKLSSKWRQELTQSIAPQMPYWVLLQVLPAAWGGDWHWTVVQLIL